MNKDYDVKREEFENEYTQINEFYDKLVASCNSDWAKHSANADTIESLCRTIFHMQGEIRSAWHRWQSYVNFGLEGQ